MAAITTYLLSTLAGLVVSCVIFITTRHIQLSQARRSRKWPESPSLHADIQSTQNEYYLFVLGSGGHTKEMLMMMDDGTRDFAKSHRRYLISSGDKISLHHVDDYEAELKRTSENPGTHDTCVVTRARRVYQPYWSTPFSALRSILDIFPALLSPPKNEVGKQLKYPGIVYSNGPATGFFVALATHLLKLFWVVPDDCLLFVYVESWARISTLSLTGKLLHCTGLADAFYVQHREVAERHGLVNAGEMVFNSQRGRLTRLASDQES
ncbi:glycosyltransferase family protein [Metarhizium album ARSEF 1941]|uniref:UDP-N-acetylglucosamine transferase subunit ALG14 n=1 Tax=Metarhizium album (strain ARSEF 1941) TaxID=1081103 RepID=A0A0B2WNF9_METAS|nr:glycosyltransferase family protein [Metarhizium album ARSEF 1941]KHN95498.1 glycosyltransferase family protein [Metarhizium album ARSEF 1941]